MYRRPFLCTLAVLAGALSTAPVANAAGWVTGPPLSPSDRFVSDPQIALLPDGSRVVAWAQTKTTRPFDADGVVVRSAAPGADFGPPQTFPGSGLQLRIATGPDGTVALAWIGAANTIHIAHRGPGRTGFTEGTPIAAPANEAPRTLDLAVTDGDAFAGFGSDGSVGRVGLTSFSVARLGAVDTALQYVPGAAGSSIAHEATNQLDDNDVRVYAGSIAAADGRVVVSYVDGSSSNRGPGGQAQVFATTRVPGAPGMFPAAQPLHRATSTGASAPALHTATAVGGGHSYVVWADAFDGVPTTFHDLDTGREAPIPGDRINNVAAEADASGKLVVAAPAIPPAGGTFVVSVASIPAGTSPSGSTRLGPVGVDRGLTSLDVASDGSTLVLSGLEGERSPAVGIEASLSSGQGALAPIEQASGIQDIPFEQDRKADGAVAPGGGAATVWLAADNSGVANTRIHVSERDATPPAFGAIAVPATATVGQSQSFAASATDAQSGTQISWDFGDGSQSDGTVVSHTFGEAGPATVTITATDDAGNSTTQTRVVAVQAPAVQTPPPGDPGNPPPPVTPPDTTKPVVTKAKLTNARFRVAPKGTAVLARATRGRAAKATPAGTTLKLTLSERSTLAIAIERKKVVRGTLVRASVPAGAASIPFTGRIGKTSLPAGSYTATITAIDGAGNRSTPVTVKFTVVKK